MRKLIIFLIALVAITFSLPKFASSKWAKREIELHLQRQIGGNVKIDTLSLKWFGEQVCHGVHFEDPNKGLCIDAEKMVIQSDLIDCLRYKEKPLFVKIHGVSLDLKAGMKWIKKTQKDLHIAFSPIDARLERGQIHFQRVELDINDKMHAYTWGKLDLNHERLKMTLGLPQPILAKVFKECRNLPEDFLLEVPVSCDLSVQSIQKKLFWYLLKNHSMIRSLKDSQRLSQK